VRNGRTMARGDFIFAMRVVPRPSVVPRDHDHVTHGGYSTASPVGAFGNSVSIVLHA
jgi:hypothetical protein